MQWHNDRQILILCFLLAALIILFSQGCSSTDHRRKQLQEEHPDCFVFESLTIECPDPFIDSSAGFGTSVINEKPTKKKKNGTNTTNPD